VLCASRQLFRQEIQKTEERRSARGKQGQTESGGLEASGAAAGDGAVVPGLRIGKGHMIRSGDLIDDRVLPEAEMFD